MKVGPRYKICKRLGNSVFDQCQTQKFTLSEARASKGMRGRRPRQMSDYGKQLLEKQRVRYTYGISEKQLQKYVKDANRIEGEPAVVLQSMLERRLDNIIYRLGLAPTRRAARQMVSHGHVQVNDKKAGIPSHIVSVGDTVSVRQKSKDSGLFTDIAERLAEWKSPTWLVFDLKKHQGTVKSEPNKDNTETMLDLGVVLEYYSR